MKPETRRFLVILTCTFILFFAADLVVKTIRNGVDDRRFKKVKVGMPEADAVAATGREPHGVTNDVKEIWMMEHDSVFDRLFLQKSSHSIRTIRIEAGKVVEVGWGGLLE